MFAFARAPPCTARGKQPSSLAAFFFSPLSFYTLSLSHSLVPFFSQSLCFLFPIFCPVYFLIIPPILSLSRIDQNPADRIKSISASFAARRPNSVRFQPRKSRSMRNEQTNATQRNATQRNATQRKAKQRDPETHKRPCCPPVFASGQNRYTRCRVVALSHVLFPSRMTRRRTPPRVRVTPGVGSWTNGDD